MDQVPKGYLEWCIKNEGEGKGPGDTLVGWCKAEVNKRKGLSLKQEKPKKVVKVETAKIENERPQVVESVSQEILMCTFDDLDFQQEENWF